MSPEDGRTARDAQSAVRSDRHGAEGRPHPLTVPVTGIFIILLIQALIVAAGFLLPVTAALLGYFILNAPRRGLQRLGVPAPIAAALFTLTITAVVVFGVTALAVPVQAFVTDLPTLMDRAMIQLTGPGGPLEAISLAAEATEEAMDEANGGNAPMQVEVVSDSSIASSVFSVAPGLLSQIIFAVCLLFFLVASGDTFIQKAIQIADRFEDKRATLQTIRMIERGLGNYLGSITLINIGLGISIGVAMWFWGMPTAYLFGIMATALNFVPFVGAVIGAAVAGISGFVFFQDTFAGFGIFLTYYALTAFEGQFVTPALLGQRLRLNKTMVFLSVAFFAWIWSVMGMVVAVPMLIVLKVICDSIPRLNKVGMFLGDADGIVSPMAGKGRRAS
ncbi:AI-2E family transporter [Jannaschia aquimarina]|uniref:TqsA protein n=1 Tax=Jannaschia aquimarina TaxID=935700 RepID=A0A0D1EMH1_9RHOB|nr:AI-2E family transporter [Jannaschia aquimarina]KIT16885.1 AI-2 transport protein TqsA [Jannaschia aquimarina]SNT12361.1 Predicted PurR-regulated permease PerM [Jannaschia aquimarina]